MGLLDCKATLTFWDGPHSVCGVCFSLNKSTSYLSLCLSLNSFWDKTSRTWGSILKSPPRGRKLTVCSHKHVEPRAAATRRLMMLTPTYLTTHQSQPIRRMPTSWSPSLWTIYIKLLTAPSRLEHTVMRALAHCSPLCLDKATKIFFSNSPRPAPPNMTWQELARQKSLCERLKPFERYVQLFFFFLPNMYS